MSDDSPRIVLKHGGSGPNPIMTALARLLDASYASDEPTEAQSDDWRGCVVAARQEYDRLRKIARVAAEYVDAAQSARTRGVDGDWSAADCRLSVLVAALQAGGFDV